MHRLSLNIERRDAQKNQKNRKIAENKKKLLMKMMILVIKSHLK